jgi:hypothetical protein
VRPLESSLKELRDSDNTESPPITELNAILLKDPELPLLSSDARIELAKAGGIPEEVGLVRPDAFSEEAC